MNKQEIYNKVKEHLLKQRIRSSNGTLCLYRGPGDTKCAVGCLIPDELYTPEMDNQPTSSLKALLNIKEYRSILELSLGLAEIDDETAKLLSDLQKVHDGDEPYYWESQLSYVAREFGLEP